MDAWALVQEQRKQLADLLATLTPEQWDHQSLCTEWRVRDIAAHIILTATLGKLPFLLGLAKAGFKPNAYLAQSARTLGSASTPEALLQTFRDRIPSQIGPPTVGPLFLLVDVIVHTGDIRRPLGLPPPPISEESLRIVAQLATGHRFVGAPKRIAGLQLQATDLDWSVGHGPLVRGPIDPLIMVMEGRPTALPELEGDGTPILAQRMSPAHAS